MKIWDVDIGELLNAPPITPEDRDKLCGDVRNIIVQQLKVSNFRLKTAFGGLEDGNWQRVVAWSLHFGVGGNLIFTYSMPPREREYGKTSLTQAADFSRSVAERREEGGKAWNAKGRERMERDSQRLPSASGGPVTCPVVINALLPVLKEQLWPQERLTLCLMFVQEYLPGQFKEDWNYHVNQNRRKQGVAADQQVQFSYLEAAGFITWEEENKIT